MLEILQRNIGSVLLSIGLSFTLWALVVNQQNPEVTRYLETSIPVEVRNVQAGLVVHGIRDETVRLQITTTADHWDAVAPTSFKAYIDLTKAEVGAREYRIATDNSDGRVRVESVDPPQTEVRVSVQKRKNVPVRVNITDSAPFGFEARPPIVTPDQVEIVGPQNVVESVATAVVNLPLSGARSSVNQTFRPEALDGAGKPVTGVEINPSAVVVEVAIEQQVAYKLVSLVPEIVGEVALGYQIVGIVPDPATVTVVGDPQTLDQLTQVTTQPIDVTNLSSDLHKNTEIVLPSGISLARRQAVVVRVYVNALEGTQSVRVTPTVKGAGEDAEVTFIPGAVDVTVSGPMPSLLSLKSQDIRVALDVTGRDPGTHVLGQPQLQVTIPAGLKLERVNPDTVAVTIK